MPSEKRAQNRRPGENRTRRAVARARPWARHAALVVMILTNGCQERTETRPNRTQNDEAQNATQDAAHDESAPHPSRETWDAVFIADTKVGFVHTTFQPLPDQQPPLLRVTSQSTLQITRYGDTVELRTSVECVETQSGAVRSFTARTEAGPSPIIVDGHYDDGRLHLTTRSQGKELTKNIAWNDSCGGFFAIERSLAKTPLQPDEKRELTMLVPGLTGVQVASTVLQADQLETVPLLESQRELLKIRQTILIGNQPIDVTHWMDERGEIQKSTSAGLGHTTFRTTEKRALAQPVNTGSDLGRDSVVHLDTPLPRPHATQRVVYQATLSTRNPVDVFESGASQQVRALDAQTVQITVLAIRPDAPERVPEESPPTEADRAPNNLIQSDNQQVRAMAARGAPTQRHPWPVCLALEKFVCDAIRTKGFGQGFATAADVALALEGDCTEHSVLLAALCRARGIPARVAIGLVYSANDRGFAFHMWNEAWVNNRWVPLDATLGQGGIGAAHLKLGHSNLALEQAETVLLDVLQVINQLQVKIVEIQH